MLDEEDAEVVVDDIDEHVLQVLGLVIVESAAGLVEQQDSRLGAQGPAQLDQPQDARGEIAGHLVASPRQTEAVEGVLDELDDVGLVGMAEAERTSEHATGVGSLGRHLEVLEDRHAGEGLQALERAPEAQPGPLVGRHVGDVPTLEPDLAGVGLVEAGEAVEERGLAGPVGTDQRSDAARRHLQRDVVDCEQTAEALDDGIGLEERHSCWASSSTRSPNSERTRSGRSPLADAASPL